MSGSGSTIFCMGMPFGEVVDTWRDELQAKYEVEIFEEMFCRRCTMLARDTTRRPCPCSGDAPQWTAPLNATRRD
jgi:hypothetical protein